MPLDDKNLQALYALPEDTRLRVKLPSSELPPGKYDHDLMGAIARAETEREREAMAELWTVVREMIERRNLGGTTVWHVLCAVELEALAHDIDPDFLAAKLRRLAEITERRRDRPRRDVERRKDQLRQQGKL